MKIIVLLLIFCSTGLSNDPFQKTATISQTHFGHGHSAETALAQAKKYKGTAQIVSQDIVHHDDGTVTVKIVTQQKVLVP
jgi:hypothetical protein